LDLLRRGREKLEEGNFYALNGLRLTHRWLKKNGFLERKVGECSLCGKCCTLSGEGFSACGFVKQVGTKYLCSVLGGPPLACLIEDGDGVIDTCTIKWERSSNA